MSQISLLNFSNPEIGYKLAQPIFWIGSTNQHLPHFLKVDGILLISRLPKMARREIRNLQEKLFGVFFIMVFLNNNYMYC